jgi:hypothetical protein
MVYSRHVPQLPSTTFTLKMTTVVCTEKTKQVQHITYLTLKAKTTLDTGHENGRVMDIYI